jgi:hypothetical protein
MAHAPSANIVSILLRQNEEIHLFYYCTIITYLVNALQTLIWNLLPRTCNIIAHPENDITINDTSIVVIHYTIIV